MNTDRNRNIKNLKDIAEFSIKEAKRSGADFTTFLGICNHKLRNRIAGGTIIQPKETDDSGIQLVLWKNGRMMTNDVQPDRGQVSAAIRYMLAVLNREELPVAHLVPPEGPFKGGFDPEYIKRAYDDETAEFSYSGSVNKIEEMVQALASKSLILDGVFSQSVSTIIIATSHGTFQTHTQTDAGFSVYAFDESEATTVGRPRLVSAFSYSGGHSLKNIDIKRMARELIVKSELQRDRVKWNPFEYHQNFTGEQFFDVIVERPFIGPLLEWTFGLIGFNGKNYLDGTSFLSGKMGQKVFGDNITIWDDPYHPKTLVSPFDCEGVSKQKMLLAENGVIKNMCYDSSLAAMIRRKNALVRLYSDYNRDITREAIDHWLEEPNSIWAQRLEKYEQEEKTHSTGHAIPASDAIKYGTLPTNVCVVGGDATIEDMVRESKKPTMWITKVHYLGLKHFQTGTITGTAQHGVFLVMDGQVICPVENLRFEMRIPEALCRVTHLGEPDLIGGELGSFMPYVVPTMRIEGFRFIGATARTK